MRRCVTNHRQHLEISDSYSPTLIFCRHIQHFQLQDIKVHRKSYSKSKNQATVCFAMRPKHRLGTKWEKIKSHSCCVQYAPQGPLHPRVAISEHVPVHLRVMDTTEHLIPSYDGFKTIYFNFKIEAFS